MTPGASRAALAAVTAVGAAGLGAAVWGVGIERYLFTVREHDVRVLPPGSRPLRVLHVSDAHMAPWQHRKQEWMATLAALEPDLVVNTGDNLGHADGLAGLRHAFDGLRGIPGVYVHGSNDRYAPTPRNPLRYFMGPSEKDPTVPQMDTGSLDRYLSDELGWTGIDNTAATLDVAGLRIDAFGVDDAHRDWDDLDALPPLRVQQRDAGSADLVLGVTHAPYRRVLDRFTDLGADLLLAGHTHGGQVRIPLSSKALVANCDIPLDQARGLSTWSHGGRDVPLNVSAGIGHSIYAPVRFGCRPEVTLLTLLPRD
ncbi:metallophosphoesterase [Microbacterium caowuchunii]|uniref:metallophosphoesterase n=1 Tax=Microbacterium caowuchunii TaxID=2614638 RepID=UPI001244F437|nr:metallophosphoesterase [Microbacterium caowuchunii]QEV99318.1 metallophosphoesterase [Microbacterium caowuchunii]